MRAIDSRFFEFAFNALGCSIRNTRPFDVTVLAPPAANTGGNPDISECVDEVVLALLQFLRLCLTDSDDDDDDDVDVDVDEEYMAAISLAVNL
jgi:hypothetical protein